MKKLIVDSAEDMRKILAGLREGVELSQADINGLAVLAGINQQLINYLNENISHLENNVKKC
jgi:hypothetical protein